MTIIKKRYWSSILYLDSVNSDYINILKNTHLPIAISPLHDKDLNENGELKKPHYHLLCAFNGPVTANNFRNTVVNLIGGVGAEPVSNFRAYYRYLCHLDDFEKAQYLEDDISKLNGFNLLNFSEPTKSEICKERIEIINLIRSHQFRYYAELIDYLIDYDQFDLFDVASNDSYFFASYIKSVDFLKK